MHRLCGGRDRFTYDFVIDGKSLAEMVCAEGLVGCLESVFTQFNVNTAGKLLRAVPADIAPDRVMFFVCAECGHLGCGAITAAVTREQDEYLWSNFRYENDYDPEMTREYPKVGPFRFQADDYRSILAASHRSTNKAL